MMANDDYLSVLRQQLVDAMRGHQAHIDFDSAMKNFPAQLQGIKPPGAPHTAWQLLEHMRIAQNDILEFSRNPEHKSPKWPDGYWPDTEVPPTSEAWSKSVKAFQKDAEEMTKIVGDLQNDLFQPFAHGDGQTLLREALLVASHNAYHLGQLMYLKRTLSS